MFVDLDCRHFFFYVGLVAACLVYLLVSFVALSSVLNNIEVVNLPHLIHATLSQFPLFRFRCFLSRSLVSNEVDIVGTYTNTAKYTERTQNAKQMNETSVYEIDYKCICIKF